MPRANARATSIPVDELEDWRNAVGLPEDSTPLDIVRGLWRAFRKAQKAGQERGDVADPDASRVKSGSTPGPLSSDPAILERQIELEKLKIERVKEERGLQAQKITFATQTRKSEYWKAVRTGRVNPPTQTTLGPAPSPESSPLIDARPKFVPGNPAYTYCSYCNEAGHDPLGCPALKKHRETFGRGQDP